jgi:hypothetical protein
MPPKDIEPLNGEFDAVVEKLVNPQAKKANNNKGLLPYKGKNPQAIKEPELDLQVQKQIEINGIGMGVLNDGTAFLTGGGLARLCGVDGSRISELGRNWNEPNPIPVTAKVKELLQARGMSLDNPYIEIKQRTQFFYAYPDFLCLAVLEFYAFDALRPTDEAKNNFRRLAGKALHDFIYTQVGYDPNNNIPVVWQQFHDRVSLTYNSVPRGYFSVFREIADMIVTLGQAGLHIDSSFVPDGSVGSHWARYWEENRLAEKFGDRQKWSHNYPDYFPQAKSNPQHPWCYPEMALGDFKRWLRETYIEGGKFSKYINDKIKQNELPPSFAEIITAAYHLEDKTTKSPD